MESQNLPLPVFDSIAFCGGCAKGAYQIGVWKALRDLHCTESIRAVSGSSIGGLNAVLFALGDFRQAKDIWFSVRTRTPFARRHFFDRAMFSRDGLMEILRKLDLQALKQSRVQVYCNILEVGTGKAVGIKLNNLPLKKQYDVLLATSAMPVVYEDVRINGKHYIDGGFIEVDNIPVETLYQHGCRNILISTLNEEFRFNPKAGMLKSADLAKLCPDASLFVISPLEPLNDSLFLEIDIDFSPRALRAKMIAGYRDTRKQLLQEGVYMMRHDYPKINAYIRLKMTGMFSSGEEIKTFLDTTNFGLPNIPMRVPGFYSDIVNIQGWRVQQDQILREHYRILDPSDICRAYTFSPNSIIRALDDYDAAGKLMDET